MYMYIFYLPPGVTKEEFLPFARSLFTQATDDRISLIVLDQETGQVVGGDFLFDYFKVGASGS